MREGTHSRKNFFDHPRQSTTMRLLVAVKSMYLSGTLCRVNRHHRSCNKHHGQSRTSSCTERANNKKCSNLLLWINSERMRWSERLRSHVDRLSKERERRRAVRFPTHHFTSTSRCPFTLAWGAGHPGATGRADASTRYKWSTVAIRKSGGLWQACRAGAQRWRLFLR